MLISSAITPQAVMLSNSFKRHENDIKLDAQAIKASLDNSILLGKNMTDRVHHMEQIASKMIVDSQNTDPFWINSVNYVASYSRHNYVNVIKVV